MLTITEFRKQFLPDTCDGNLISREYGKYFKENVQIGDRVTECHWSDRESYTVIGKTAKTLVIQRCKTQLSPDWKPEWVTGGFSAICVNDTDQKWIIEDDPSGYVKRAYWSNKRNGYYSNGQNYHIIPGAHEYYDYNF